MKHIFLFSFIICLFSFCKRTDKDGVLGPEIKAASPNFQVLDTLRANYFNGRTIAKNDSISFQYIQNITRDSFNVNTNKHITILTKVNIFSRKVFFKAKFNQEVSWNLTLYKLLNGQKDVNFSTTLTGTSSSLDSSNTGWDGNAGLNLFALGDKVISELTFVQGSTLVVRDTLIVAQGPYYSPTSAKILSDFENGLSNAYAYIDKTDSKPSPIPSIDKSLIPPQGVNSFRIYGTDFNGDYFCGGMNIQQLDTYVMRNFSPKDIYINIYIYGYPPGNSLLISTKSTKLNIGFSEDDYITDGVFDPLTEDTFEKQINVDWAGWKLVSIRYGDLVRSNSKTSGGSGNGIFQPGLAFSVNCNLISSPNGATVGANIDYVIITYGQPFDSTSL